MKRTKGGLMPWWVRKRLQEHSEPDLKGSTGAKEKPVKAKRKTPNILEVGHQCFSKSPYAMCQHVAGCQSLPSLSSACKRLRAGCAHLGGGARAKRAGTRGC